MINFAYLAPPQAANYIQHTEYYIKHNEKEKGARKIYENVQYDSFEQEKIRELKKEIEIQKIDLSSDWRESDYLKIGYSGRFKMKEVIKKLIAHLAWRNNPIYHQINEKTEKFLQNGICYVFGRDKQFRPIVILNAHLIDLKKYDKETIIQALSFQMGIIKKHMFIPGKVENWIFILESNGLGVLGLPISALQIVIETMSTNFGGCLEKMFILNPSGGLNFLWKTISKFLDPETAQKINFYQKKDFKNLLEIIDQNQLEMKYGGTQPNQIKFWPPYNLDLPDGYTLPKTNHEQTISEQQPISPQVDPYDKVENNVNDFFETQKKLYQTDLKSAEFGYRISDPNAKQEEQQQSNENIQKQQQQQQQQQQQDDQDQFEQQQQQQQQIQQQPPEEQVQDQCQQEVPEQINIQQEESEQIQHAKHFEEKNDQESKIQIEQQTSQQPQIVEQEIEQIQVDAQKTELIVCAAGNEDNNKKEITKIDPVANPSNCCQTCIIF